MPHWSDVVALWCLVAAAVIYLHQSSEETAGQQLHFSPDVVTPAVEDSHQH